MSRRRRRRRSPEEQANRREKRIAHVKRGIYLIPTLITIVNFGSGFTSILYSLEGFYTTAAYLIIFAMVADVLDGAMARITRTESAFGRELDSLADVVSFGCAPAILIYQRFELSPHPYWIFPLFFAVAGALRLARYNVDDAGAETKDKDFRGTPIPAAAAVIVGLVLVVEKYKPEEYLLSPQIIAACVFLLSYLMLSNVRYPSIKMIHNPEKPLPFRFLVLVLLLIILLIYRFSLTLISLVTLYYISGPLIGIRRKRKTPGEQSHNPVEVDNENEGIEERS